MSELSGVTVRAVTGWEGRTNDLITLGDRDPAIMEGVIMFCGGDVQDLEERMLSHRDNSRYSHWSLERTALLLGKVSLAFFSRDILAALMCIYFRGESQVKCNLLACFHPTICSLLKASPRSYIVVVRPSRMERATFSCYDNFVTSNSAVWGLRSTVTMPGPCLISAICSEDLRW